MMGADLDRARDALHAIAPDAPREVWVRAGMAAHAAGLSFEDFDAWSASAQNYDSRAARDTWRSFKPGRGVGAGTLFAMAHAEGWTDAAGRTVQRSPRNTAARPIEARSSRKPNRSAAELWECLEPATHAHGYVTAKAGVPDGLCVVPADDPLTVAGLPMAGALVVPVRPLAGGDPVSLQFIASPAQAASWKASGRPSKLNLPGAPVAGVYVVGELVAGGTVHVVEGIGQAWACWKATGHAAVAAFGWGRVRAVAAELRQRDASARVVLVPDAGLEREATSIALELGAACVSMPEGSPRNFDACDFALAHGHDALEALLCDAVREPARPVHPLAQFVDIGTEPAAPRWVIPGFIGHGLVVIAGAHGAGKTTALLPLAMVVAGLHGHGEPMAPRHWRHVVYVTEDIEQARRIVAGIVGFGGMDLDLATVRDRLHLVEARRLEPAYVTEVAATYQQRFTRSVDGVEVLPLVVFDTKAAVLALDDENSNSEASTCVAMLRQAFEGLPVWLVGHVAKASMGRADVAGLSLRGGSAFEADATQVLYLVREGEARYLVRGKTRFEARWPELAIESQSATTTGRDEFGHTEPLTLRWGICRPPEQSRKEAQEQAQEAQRKADVAALRGEVRNAVEAAWAGGFPLNREAVKARIRRNRAEVAACIENLLSERWLHEVAIPPKHRTNPKRSAFLVNLTTEEHEAALRGEGLPPLKMEIPASWQRPSVPADAPEETPAPGGEC